VPDVVVGSGDLLGSRVIWSFAGVDGDLVAPATEEYEEEKERPEECGKEEEAEIAECEVCQKIQFT